MNQPQDGKNQPQDVNYGIIFGKKTKKLSKNAAFLELLDVAKEYNIPLERLKGVLKNLAPTLKTAKTL